MVSALGVLFGASCQSVSTQKPEDIVDGVSKQTMTLMFYNVENLFDIYDNPETLDDDFTPQGKLGWNEDRYQTKLFRLAEVIDAIPGDWPAFIGLAEVENRQVLQDLLLANAEMSRYKIIHQDSPDERGIDVAALIDTTLLSIERYHYTTINLPNDVDPHTRDILYIKGKAQGEVIHFFVNHWPSRGGGQVETEKNRIAVANVLKSKINQIQQGDKNAKLIVMGDFNDHPNDRSIAEILGAGISDHDRLFNFMYSDHMQGKGSYWYKGSWGALDQFIVSPNIATGRKGWVAENAFFYDDRQVMFQDSKGELRPNRTYAGTKYTAGYSDHLAIYLPMKFR